MVTRKKITLIKRKTIKRESLMTKEEIIQYFGSQSSVAKALNLRDPRTIYKWKRVPMWHQKAIEVISNGKLKSDPMSYKPTNEHTNERRLILSWMPIDTVELFKEVCKKQKVTMTAKIVKYMEGEINRSP